MKQIGSKIIKIEANNYDISLHSIKFIIIIPNSNFKKDLCIDCQMEFVYHTYGNWGGLGLSVVVFISLLLVESAVEKELIAIYPHLVKPIFNDSSGSYIYHLVFVDLASIINTWLEVIVALLQI